MALSEKERQQIARAKQGDGGLVPKKPIDRTHRVLNYPGLDYFYNKLKTEGLGSGSGADNAGELEHLAGFAIDESGHLVAITEDAVLRGHVSFQLVNGRLIGTYDNSVQLLQANQYDGHLYIDYNTAFDTTPYMVQVWENDSPESEFTAQEIEVSLTPYAGVVIEYSVYNSDSPSKVTQVATSRVIPIGDGDPLMYVALRYGYYGGRCCTVLKDKVVFGYGHNHAFAASNGISIPRAIYGVFKANKPLVPVWANSGRTYLIYPRDMERGLITEVTGGYPTSCKAPLFTDWLYSWCGVGFTLVSQMASSSYCFMRSVETIDLTDYTNLHIRGAARCYSTSDVIGLISSSYDPSTHSRTDNSTEALTYGNKPTATNNKWTAFEWDIEITNATGEYYLFAQCAGSGDNNYCGIICIEEAYLE